jgi:arylsulfatase
METVDDEFRAAAIDFMDRAKKANKPFFVWFNTTRMHNFTHVRAENRKSGLGEYADGMIEHDAQIGKLLDYVDQAGLVKDTIVVYTTDNGPMVCLWPDAGSTPFRGEKNTNWEGGWRVPAMVRWPGTIKPGTVINDIFAGEDWLPTLLAAAGAPDVKDKLLRGYEAGKSSFKVHLDGYDQSDLLAGKGPGKRREFFYFSDDGDLVATRYDNWKLVFMEQRVAGTLLIWAEPFVSLRVPKMFNLRTDPFERADVTSNTYYDWMLDRVFLIIPSQKVVGEFLATFMKYPPRQKAASFTIDQVLAKMEAAMQSGR